MSIQARPESAGISRRDLLTGLRPTTTSPSEGPAVISTPKPVSSEANTSKNVSRRSAVAAISLVAALAFNPKEAISLFIAPAVHAEPDWVYFQGDVWSSKQYGPHLANQALGRHPLHEQGGALEKLDSLVGVMTGTPGFSQHSAAKIAEYSLNNSPEGIRGDLGHCRELAFAGLVSPRPAYPEGREIGGIYFSFEDLAGLRVAEQIGSPYQAHSRDANVTAHRLSDFARTGGRTRLIIVQPELWFRAVAGVSPDGQRVLAENFGGDRKTIEREAIVATQAVAVPGAQLSPEQQNYRNQFELKGLNRQVINQVCNG